MKLLFYNWTPVDANQSAGGGGVTVYQRNLIKNLLNMERHEIFFLNSGFTFKADNPQMALNEVPNKISNKLKTFELINSPVIAPVQQSILNVRHYLEDENIYLLLKKFIDYFGGFDVIHFNNLEGLSLSALRLKEVYPNTKFIYSLHNYFLLCTKVSLWQNQINKPGHICNKKDYGECQNCYPKLNYNSEIFSRRYEHIAGIRLFSSIYSQNFPDVDDVKLYREFEERNILYANRYFDKMLAVSKRVKEIFVKRGINESKVEVSYIGTNIADFQKMKSTANIKADPFKMIYMGYMTEDKGFVFFLHTLYEMDEKLSKKIVVTVAAKHNNIQNKIELDLLQKLKSKFRDIILLNGYSHDNQAQILEDQNLGIVPVLWEDNLPQVAIEQIANGVPILCSDCGGVSELHNYNTDFTFKAGNVKEFLEKLNKIIENRHLLSDYWKSVQHLTTMKEHIDYLEKIYQN